MYEWRNMTLEERQRAMATRKQAKVPWHSPPHWNMDGERKYLISATCYEHACLLDKSLERMAQCEQQLLEVCHSHSTSVCAWCILPNHYHVLLQTACIKHLRAELGKFHGRSSHRWNKEDDQPGRHVWHNCFDRVVKSEGHFWASLNYIHHNPVKHGYVKRWQEWLFSSAAMWLETVGRERAEQVWRSYPILDYGKDWDF